MKIQESVLSVKAYAPATSANVAVGFDLLGFPIEGVGDTVTLSKRTDKKITLSMGDSSATLPLDAAKNTASCVVVQLLSELGIEQGFDIVLQKGIPLCSGMGGSAASAVASLTALNGFFETPLSLLEICQAALYGEKIATGSAHVPACFSCLSKIMFTSCNAYC